MPLSAYGVLRARAVDRRREGASDTPHFQIQLADEAGTDFRIAVNVKSQESPSELLYVLDDDLRHPITALLVGLGSGWQALAPRPDAGGLDFIRANLFEPAKVRKLPPDVEGPDNDLADLLDHYVQRAIGDAAADVYAFGQRWGPENAIKDKVFGFDPGNGVHDIHMNQGNSPRFAGDDGVWQDGGLLLHFPGESRWVAIFLAFQSQAWHTDDRTGHALAHVPTPPGPPPQPPPGPGPQPGEASEVRVLAAMVNPVGPAPEHETVLLLNTSPDPVDLTGWRIADRLKRTSAVAAGPLAAGETLEVPLGDGAQLGNRGGAITLLDAAGLKVDGVAYTAEQAGREGWTLTF